MKKQKQGSREGESIEMQNELQPICEAEINWPEQEEGSEAPVKDHLLVKYGMTKGAKMSRGNGSSSEPCRPTDRQRQPPQPLGWTLELIALLAVSPAAVPA